MDIVVDVFLPAAVAALWHQTDVPSNVYRDIEILRRDLEMIYAMYLDWSSNAVGVLGPTALAESVGDLAYDVEDWANLYAHRVVPSSSRILRWIRRGVHKLTTRSLPIRHTIITSELRELQVRAEELGKRGTMFIASAAVAEADEPVDPRLTTTRFTDAGSLVGLNRPIEEVTKMVTSAGGKQAAELKVVSIVGMAGSGKTTLAAAVYRQLRRHNCFQLQAFVSVGKKPDAVLKALGDMLLELADGHPVVPSEDRLIPRLREILENKSCLIVVDDLWSGEDWQRIKTCFPEVSLAGSQIITTTRNLELAKVCCQGSSDCIYNIRLLNEVHSKKLILDSAFGIGHGCPKHLEDVLAQIIRRCSGLPLALVTVPSMLEDKSSMDEWDRLVGSRWLSCPDAKAMKQILNLSYSDLPRDLKICLLDLSIFPEDFKVDVDRLVRRWIAEGYIPEMYYLCAEEVARSFIQELISTNMVQPLYLVHGAPRCFRLHPVIHDFLICKSMENNFVTLVDDQNPPISSNCTVYRRLSVRSSNHDQDLMMSYDGMDLSHVRSITVFGQASVAPRLINLHVVRVLDLEGCVGLVCLDGIDKLLLLRYLSLKGTEVTELPATIWELRFLETLDIRSTKVKELSCSIVKLRGTLKTLLFSYEGMVNSIETTTRIAEHCRWLQNLGTLDLREQRASFVKDLGELKDLMMLEITWSFHQCTEGDYRKSLLSSMEKWSKLRSLTIHCGLGCCMEFLDSLSHPPQRLEEFKVTAGNFVRVPDWIKMLGCLSFLQINICKIGTDDLNLLRGLPRLQFLILGLDFVPRNAIVIESDGFSELLSFSVNCPVPWLTFQAGAMPRLTHLQLELCSGSTNPESVPSGISNLQKLTEVVLLYNQKWCADSSSVRMTVDAVQSQVTKHHNLIDLTIKGTKADVQNVDGEMKSTTEIQSGDAGEEAARTTVETTQGEIEIVAECDYIRSSY